jgi:hypothetical protein
VPKRIWNKKKNLSDPAPFHSDFSKFLTRFGRFNPKTFWYLKVRGNMKAGKKPFSDRQGKKAPEVLAAFIGLFESKGWLNQTIRIRRSQRRYRISCNETGFIAYRINDHCGISPGIPGWPVCIVTREQVVNDSDLSGLPSTEPGVQDWLRFIMDDDLELI